jgi:hypothetical protein
VYDMSFDWLCSELFSIQSCQHLYFSQWPHCHSEHAQPGVECPWIRTPVRCPYKWWGETREESRKVAGWEFYWSVDPSNDTDELRRSSHIGSVLCVKHILETGISAAFRPLEEGMSRMGDAALLMLQCCFIPRSRRGPK